MSEEAMTTAIAPLTLTLPFPDHGLTKNRSRSGFGSQWGMLRKIEEAQQQAVLAAVAHPALTRDAPYFPSADPLFAVIRAERHKRGQRWDYGGMVEASKPYVDALQGWVYPNDRQVIGSLVLWDTTPTGRGVIHVTFLPAAALLAVIADMKTDEDAA